MTKERRTAYFMGDDAEFFKECCCALCCTPAKEWINIDKYGNFESDIYEDKNGDMCGILCPKCAGN